MMCCADCLQFVEVDFEATFRFPATALSTYVRNVAEAIEVVGLTGLRFSRYHAQFLVAGIDLPS